MTNKTKLETQQKSSKLKRQKDKDQYFLYNQDDKEEKELVSAYSPRGWRGEYSNNEMFY